MTPEEFRQAWTAAGDAIFPLPPEQLAGLGLRRATEDFLIRSGLPDAAAPFLSFVKDSGRPHERISRMTALTDLDPVFDKYISIGSNGGGNPVAINTAAEDCVELLDHDFDFAATFMNSSVSALAEFLWLYREFIHDINKERGDNAYLDGNFPEKRFHTLLENMKRVDKAAVEKGFWQAELDGLMTDHKAFLKKKKWWKFW